VRNANYDGCEKNGIKYPAEMRNLPPLHRIYYKAIGESRSDKLYYFNANHLGSGSLITDGNGQTYQILAYCPYGESLINIKKAGSYDEPYRFGGKIKDEESGLNYFEARYYDENVGFISVDPLAEQSPDVSGYHYCHWSPTMRTDPTGLADPIPYTDKWSYEGQPLAGIPGTFIANVAIGLTNAVTGLLNTAYNAGETAYQEGFDVLYWNTAESVNGSIDAMKKDLSRPVSEQTQGVLNDWSSASFWEDFTGNALMLLAAKKLPATKATITTSATTTLRPLGLGSTGRTIAKNLTEKLTMEEIMSNPTKGRIVKMSKGMTDNRWLQSDGWEKMSWRNGNVEIHYVGKWENGILKAVDDFKFKDN
jgi:RHS repeat-associated protein